MKKIIAVIPITILFILLSQNINIFAKTFNDVLSPNDYYNTALVAKLNDDTYYIFEKDGNYSLIVNQNFSIGTTSIGYTYYVAQGFNPILNPDRSFGDGWESSPLSTIFTEIIYVKGNVINNSDNPNYYDSVEDYIHKDDPPPPDPPWYEEMFEEFVGAIEGIASIATGGFSNLVEAFTEFWVVPVGGDEGDMFFPTDIVMVSPTPTPTPIQYQTVIAPTTDPHGNVIYQYKYVYNNPSGTPIITDSPPVNNNGGGNSFDYPYYDNPENNNNPYKLNIPWYLKLIFGNKIVDETTLDNSVNVIQDYMNDDDINDGVTTVYDGMSAIPTDWLILIGVIASIPLFGCLISRLLS